MKDAPMQVFRVLTAVVAWLTLVLQYWSLMAAASGGGPYDPDPIARTINFFSFFSIISTILVGMAMTLPALAPNGAWGRFWACTSVRAGIAVYIVIVGTVYVLVLRRTWQPQGLQIYTDAALHYVVPVLYVCDWLVFVPKGALQPKDAFTWLQFPSGYAIWTLAHGALTGFYPYPFVNVTSLGYAATLLNIAGFVVAFLTLGLVVVGIDRLIWRSVHKP
jgi:hypothetical protein